MTVHLMVIIYPDELDSAKLVWMAMDGVGILWALLSSGGGSCQYLVSS